ncbi:Hypothetical protein HDN1F_01490 [gamma proteobacterium HdN1]|nr:Hypothetical protein HDN1F_01490 [gamma proteobacterium HdN1]
MTVLCRQRTLHPRKAPPKKSTPKKNPAKKNKDKDEKGMSIHTAIERTKAKTHPSTIVKFGLFCLLAALGSGCANTVQYGDSGRGETRTTETGIHDLQSATTQMTEAMINDIRVMAYTYGRRPTIAISPFTNQSGNAVSVAPLQRSIVESLQKQDAYQIIDEQKLAETRNQLQLPPNKALTTPGSGPQLAKALGADLLLYGEISEVIRVHPDSRETYYRIELHLVDGKNGNLIWQEKKEFLKSGKKAIFGA